MDTTSLRVALSKLRRKLTFWRVLALASIGVLLLVLIQWRADGVIREDHVARVRVDGFILGREEKIDLIDRLAEKKNVRAVIVRINSPGGTTSGSEALYKALRRVAEKKPVVTVMDGIATSGGYMTALAGERMFAGGNTITGSIGVIVQWPEVHELLTRLGVKMQAVRSGPLKALPNSVEPTPPAARRVIEEMVRDSYEWFISLVAERRGLDIEKVRQLADGRVYTGRQALKAGLVDALGDERVARRWLEKTHKIAFSIKVREYRPERPLLRQLGLSGVASRMLGMAGLEEVVARLFAPGARVDGLLSVWHPEATIAGER